MQAWMNRSSIKETLETKHVCYWSRSRKDYWRKGETSGNVQLLVNMIADCDGDSLLLLVDQTVVACHTGVRSCFFDEVKPIDYQDKSGESYEDQLPHLKS